MKTPGFNTIGISILIVLNLIIAGVLIFGRPGRHGMHGPMGGHDKDRVHQRGPGKDFTNGHNHPVNDRKAWHMRDGFGHRPMDDLNLSEDQKAKMEKLRKEHREKSEALMEKTGELRKKEAELLKSGTLDDARMNALATEFAQYQKELHLLKLNHFKSINTILTPEQKEKFQERFKDRKEGWRRHQPMED